MSIENGSARDSGRKPGGFWGWVLCCAIVVFGLAATAEGSDSLRVYVVDRDSRAVVGALLTDLGTHSTICKTDGAGNCSVERHGSIAFEVSAVGFSNERVAVDESVFATTVTLHIANKAVVVVSADAHNSVATEQSVLLRAEDIDRLPVWLRKAESLPAVAPGSIAPPTDDEWGQGVSTAGTRLTTTNSTLDQMPNRSERRGGMALQPSLDAVAELEVLSSGYAAEYGHTPGAQVVMTTRSGTDHFHGSIYDYARDRIGGVLGGPILRDRAFFFASYEGNNTDFGNPVTSSVPDSSELAGDFPSLSSPLNIPGLTTSTTAFNGSIIPAAAISQNAKKLLALIPASTSGQTSNVGEHTGSKQMLVRLDEQLNTSSRVMFRVARMDYKSVLQPYAQQILPASWPVSHDITNSVAATYSRTHMDSVLEIRTSYMDTRGSSKGACHNDPHYEVTLADGYPSNGCPIVAIDGFLPFGDAFHLYSYRSRPFEIATDYSRTVHGRNRVKVGAAYNRVYYQSQDPTQENGYLSFTGKYTGNPIADFLLFLPSVALRSFESASSKGSLNQVTFSAYAQDFLRLTSRFQLDLGLRVEYLPRMVGRSPNLTSFWPQLGFVQDGTQQNLLQSQGAIVNPRLGFVWNLFDSKTIVRGGVGLFGGEDDLASTLGQLTDAQPPRAAVTTAPGSAALNPSDLRWVRINPGVTRGIDPRNIASMVYEYTLALERSLPHNIVIAVSYVGSRGTHLGRLYNINQPLPTGTLDASGQPISARSYPSLGDVLFEDHGASSRYNEGRIEIRKQTSGGIHFRLAYMFSKSLDDSSAVTETNWSGMEYAQDLRNLKAEWGPSDFDHRHRIAGFLTVPLDHYTNAAVLRRSSISAVANAMSGQRFTVLVNDNLRPDLVSNPYANVPAGYFFNPNAFAAHVPTTAQPYLFGNLGRNSLRGPYFNTIDLAFNKGFKLKRAVIDLRIECFNVLDRNVHSITNYLGAGFGMARSSLNQSRLIIAGGRIGF